MELHVPTALKYLECVRNTNEVRTECTKYLGIRIIIVQFQTFDFTKENNRIILIHNNYQILRLSVNNLENVGR